MSCTDHTTPILATLAHLAAARTGVEGSVLRHALYAAMLAAELHLSPTDADDRAAEPARSDAEQAVDERARHLIAQARTAIHAAEWTPNPGDVVTQDGTDGTWIVRGWEDDDFVWIHRPDVRMVPTIGRNTATAIDLAGWRDEPEHEELAAAVDLRPAQADTDKPAAPARVATIHRRPGLRPGQHIYAIGYAVDGEPAGGSLALPKDLDEWKADLAAAGWTVVDAPDDGEQTAELAETAGGAR